MPPNQESELWAWKVAIFTQLKYHKQAESRQGNVLFVRELFTKVKGRMRHTDVACVV